MFGYWGDGFAREVGDWEGGGRNALFKAECLGGGVVVLAVFVCFASFCAGGGVAALRLAGVAAGRCL